MSPVVSHQVARDGDSASWMLRCWQQTSASYASVLSCPPAFPHCVSGIKARCTGITPSSQAPAQPQDTLWVQKFA
jgi:hypothetical protein